jgi:hypothetical protein
MTTNAMKTLKLIALATLVVAGCDPYTKTPTGTPAVIRAIASDGVTPIDANSVADQNNIVVDDASLSDLFYVWFNLGLDGSTVQATPSTDAAGNPLDPTVATNGPTSPLATKTFTPPGGTAGGLPSDQATGTITTTAVLGGDTLVIGSTKLTAGTDWVAAGTDVQDAAALAAAINANTALSAIVVADASGQTVNLTAVKGGIVGNDIALHGNASRLVVSGSTLTGGVDSSIAYQPGSASNGGIIVVSPPDFWNVGAYTIGGTVKDTGGNPGTFKVTFNVTHIPVTVNADAYTVDIGWANDPKATGFTVQIQPSADLSVAPGSTSWVTVETNVPWETPGSTANNEIFRILSLVPGDSYWIRVLPEGLTGTAAPSTPSGVTMASVPSLKAVGNPITTVAANGADSTVQLSFARIRSAAYHIETALPVTSGTPVWSDVPATSMTNAQTGAAISANPVPASSSSPYVIYVSGVSVGKHMYRVTPIWDPVLLPASAAPNPGPGTPLNTATATVAH